MPLAITRHIVSVSSSIGNVSAEVVKSDRVDVAMVLAHGAGAGMDHPFLVTLSHRLAEKQIAVVRFNFPFIEQKKKRPDVHAVAMKTVESALHFTHQMFPGIPTVAGGKSFGGRMSSQLLAGEPFDFVKAIVFYGFPLHSANQSGTERANHLFQLGIPKLFLQGTRDALAEPQLIERVCNQLSNVQLEFIEGADHSFKTVKYKDVIDHLSIKTQDWLKHVNILR